MDLAPTIIEVPWPVFIAALMMGAFAAFAFIMFSAIGLWQLAKMVWGFWMRLDGKSWPGKK